MADPIRGGGIATHIFMLHFFLDNTLDIVVLDSIAALIPAVEEEESAEKFTIGQHARLVAKAFRKITVANKNSVFIGINQLRREIGPYGKETYPGGEYQKYAAHIIMRIKRAEWIKEKTKQGEKRIGFDINIETVKNKVSSPWKDCTIQFLFNGEIDEMMSNIDYALSKNIIRKAGPYYGYGEIKELGKQALRLKFQELPDEYEKMLKELGD